jgi:hypothetical protein
MTDQGIDTTPKTSGTAGIDGAELAWSCASVGLGKTAHRQPPVILGSYECVD